MTIYFGGMGVGEGFNPAIAYTVSTSSNLFTFDTGLPTVSVVFPASLNPATPITLVKDRTPPRSAGPHAGRDATRRRSGRPRSRRADR
mgnify:CR=1 FL=1